MLLHPFILNNYNTKKRAGLTPNYARVQVTRASRSSYLSCDNKYCTECLFVYQVFTDTIIRLNKNDSTFKFWVALKFTLRSMMKKNLSKTSEKHEGGVKDIAFSIKKLNINLSYQHRVDPDIPIEETVGAMADLVKAGKVPALAFQRHPLPLFVDKLRETPKKRIALLHRWI